MTSRKGPDPACILDNVVDTARKESQPSCIYRAWIQVRLRGASLVKFIQQNIWVVDKISLELLMIPFYAFDTTKATV